MHDNSNPGRRRVPAVGRGLAVLAAGLACAAGLAAGSPAQAATGHGPLALPPGNTQLSAVSADSASDAWAVGSAYTAPFGSGFYQSLALHWNGTSWVKVKTPDPGGTRGGDNTGTRLNGVAAISPTNAWAVGYYLTTDTGTWHPLLLHWNGTTWAKATVPSLAGSVSLESISADSATDIWVVASSISSGNAPVKNVMLHYNGTAWSKVTAPNPGASPWGDFLTAVKAISPTDAWAGGGSWTSGGGYGSFMLHWNGTTWARAAAPSPGGTGQNNIVNAVGASSATNVLGVGFYTTGTVSTGYDASLGLKLNGSAWSQTTTPNPGGTSPADTNFLDGVDTTSATDGWAVGSYSTSGSTTAPGSLSLALRWNGSTWTQVTTPNPATTKGINDLTAVSERTSSDAWAVGYYAHNTPDETLILHWNGTSWAKVTSPN